MNPKPTVFFSHSSIDKEYLLLLKKKILNKISSTINIFLSSDGESIRFGQNWVSKIEKSLNDAKLMFVFISPKSVKSNWVYFESGYSYSKGIDVVPIGINGIDIGILKPPINLLQGFNLKSEEGLNNILDIINKKFDTSFPLDFIGSDYTKLIKKVPYLENQNSMSRYVDCYEFRFDKEIWIGDKLLPRKSDPLNRCEKVLSKANIEYFLKNKGKNPYEISTYGMMINYIGGDSPLIIRVDPDSLENNLPRIHALGSELTDSNELPWGYIFFNTVVHMIDKSYSISSKLHNAEINYDKDLKRVFRFKNLLFNFINLSDSTSRSYKFLRKDYVAILINDPKIYNQLNELIEILFSSGVCYTSSSDLTMYPSNS